MKQLLEKFNSLNDQARYSILVVVIFLVILSDVIFLILPQMASIADVNDQIKKLSDDTRQVLADRQRINQLKKSLAAARDQYKSIGIKMRTLQEIPAILSTISSIANEYGVKIDQLVPKKEEQEVIKVPARVGKFYILPIVIKAHCGYHMFGHFLNKLENENLYFIMKDFIIQNDDKDPNSRLFSLTINIVLEDRTSPAKNL